MFEITADILSFHYVIEKMGLFTNVNFIEKVAC